MRERDQQASENKHIISQIILATQGLPFRGHQDDKVDFSIEDVNLGNIIATLQLMSKAFWTNTLLPKYINLKWSCPHLCVQNQGKVDYKSVKCHSQSYQTPQIIMPTGRSFLYAWGLWSPQYPHIKKCLLSFIHLDTISRNILEAISDPFVSLDPSRIRGQSYDGASVMSSEVAGVQPKIKEVSPRAHCYSHCHCCGVQESYINNQWVSLLSCNSPKRQY